MPSIKSPGLILKKIPFSETSIILKVFTRDSGLITLIAKGAKRPKSKYHGLLDFFTLNQFVYPEKSKSDILTLLEVSLIHDYPTLKSDPGRMALGSVFMELYTKYMHEPAPSPPHYELLVEGMEQLENARKENFDPVAHACDFLLGLCAVSGFSPQFLECVQCSRAALGIRVRMDPDLGGPICSDCSPRIGGGITFSSRLAQWLDRVQDRGLRAGRLSQEEELQGESFLLDFLGKHAGGARQVKSLEFYHQTLANYFS
jgi:DNA repair protein RecO (recombination protein O)